MTQAYKIIEGNKYKARLWGVSQEEAKETAKRWRYGWGSCRVIKDNKDNDYAVYVSV